MTIARQLIIKLNLFISRKKYWNWNIGLGWKVHSWHSWVWFMPEYDLCLSMIYAWVWSMPEYDLCLSGLILTVLQSETLLNTFCCFVIHWIHFPPEILLSKEPQSHPMKNENPRPDMEKCRLTYPVTGTSLDHFMGTGPKNKDHRAWTPNTPQNTLDVETRVKTLHCFGYSVLSIQHGLAGHELV